MTIIITMNIYITKDNEAFLRKIKPSESMSGIINKLLDDYRSGKGEDLFPPSDRTPHADIKTCKHGYDPNYCKHAKLGKPCK